MKILILLAACVIAAPAAVTVEKTAYKGVAQLLPHRQRRR
jgi:hypothetical protein